MSHLDRNDTLAKLQSGRVSAIIRTEDRALAADAMRAAVAGGFRNIEFTLTTPGALDLIAEFAREDHLVVGAGTVMTTDQVRQSVEAGARFIVSPVTDAAVISEARGLGAVTIPGTFTATEMMAAHDAGADLLKLFPAPADVAAYVKAILGPLPFLKIYPTSGVTEENFQEILKAGAAGVGFVSSIFDAQDMARRDFTAIERRAARIVGRLEAQAA